ncbi:MAG: tRNA lysidine(34) synthetase TilS [Acidobacteriia bacterium]|nr:tRNA lysidine(34) synthetase TilS [Terriglobia bacterium]
MRQRFLSYIRQHDLMRPGDRVGVAVSGGADSVALLRLLLEARAELGIVLSVVHFNHKIRGADADADEQFVCSLARSFDLQFQCGSDDTPAYARAHKLSLEAAARKLRYTFFWKLTDPEEGFLERVATAHTLDDQAETVLLKFLRGAWTRGLSAIALSTGEGMKMSPEAKLPPRIVRPLLEISHEQLTGYLRRLKQPWREDVTNQDVSFLRNRVRHELLPILKRDYNPAIDRALSDMAEIARAEEDYWTDETEKLYFKLIGPPRDHAEAVARGGPVSVDLKPLQGQPLALRRRVMRQVVSFLGSTLDLHQSDALVEVASAEGPEGKALSLPHGWEAVRQGQELRLRRRCQTNKEQREYDLALAVPGEVGVAGARIRAAMVSGEPREPAGEGARATRVLLDPALAKGELRVRNWRAGDRYWPAHTRETKKLKELLQARHIPREQKPFWPVVVSGEEIVWVPGFAAPEQFRVRETAAEALLLEEVPLVPRGENEP